MKISFPQLNYKHLLAEFVVVVVGVAVALTADEWRQDLALKSAQGEYLSRIADELELGSSQYNTMHERLQRVLNAAADLSTASDHGVLVAKDEAIAKLLQTAQVGSTSASISHDEAYQELVSAGNLNIISDSEIRASLRDYYRSASNIDSLRAGIDRSLTDRLTQLTGRPAFVFVNNPEELTEYARNRIYGEYTEEPELIQLVRGVHSDIWMLLRGLEDAISQNRALASKIRSSESGI